MSYSKAEDERDGVVYSGPFQVDGVEVVGTVYSNGVAILSDGTLLPVNPDYFRCDSED